MMSKTNPMGLNKATDTELREVVGEADDILQEIAPHFATAETPIEVQILSDFYTTVYMHKLAATSSLTVRRAS
jgi:uncharacterized membrane-anchored protein YhcB (DUF1043 family)